MCRLEKNWEPRCRLWGLDWKSTLEVAVRWSSSPPTPSPSHSPSPPPSSSPPHHQRQGNVKKQAIFVMAWHWILSFSSTSSSISSFSSSAGWLQPSECEQQSWSRLDMPVKSRNEAMRIWKGTEKWKDRQGHKQTKWRRKGGGHLCNISEVLVMSCVLFIVESIRRSQI